MSSLMATPCVLCGSHEDDDVVFGRIKIRGGVKAHYNCLILSFKQFVQVGDDVIDLMDYLRDDVLFEVERCSTIKCFYCRRLGANLSCVYKNCGRSFHLKCGMDNSVNIHYGGHFDIFCDRHVPEFHRHPEPKDECIICMDEVVPEGDTFSIARALQPACCHNGWYHRVCLQKYALYADNNFRCPLCRNMIKFMKVTKYGISLPNWRYFIPVLAPMASEPDD